jgi:hypothetical protein
MNATRYILAAMVMGSAIGVNQADAQCSGNAGTCNLTNTVTASVNNLVKLAMSTAGTSLTSPTADQVEVGANLADNGPSFTVKANRSWTLNIKISRYLRRYQLGGRTFHLWCNCDERRGPAGVLQDSVGRWFHSAEQCPRFLQLAGSLYSFGAVTGVAAPSKHLNKRSLPGND